MVRLMIVDDDAIIRKGLTKNIPWEDNGFQLVGTAGDGEEGYQLYLETKPEIIISDIKMPFADGLELARRILKDQSGAKIILLTGYEEFEYAKQALEMKVFNYLLKPVDLENLLDTARRAAQLLEIERKAKWRLQESKPLLIQRFLTRLIGRKYRSSLEAEQEARFLEINFPEDRFIVLVIKIDNDSNSETFSKFAEHEVAKLNIANLCKEYLPVQKGEVLDPGGDELVLICSSRLKPGEAIQHALELGETIKEQINKAFSINITVGVGRLHDGLLEIATSYEEAKAATEFRHIIGKNQVLFVGDTGMPVCGDPPDLPEIYESLGLKVKMGLTAESLAIIDNIEEKILDRRFISLSSVRLIGMHLAILTLQAAEIWNEEKSGQQTQFFFERCRLIQEGQTIEEIFNEVRHLLTELTGMINRRRESLQSSLVGAAIQYIEANFNKEGLSLSEVANVVHVSPVYLSIMFKKEHNINFSDFLTEVRMKKAMELLREGDLKTYEVAERVGYSNPQYFSVCFKKYTGYSPSEFKKR